MRTPRTKQAWGVGFERTTSVMIVALAPALHANPIGTSGGGGVFGRCRCARCEAIVAHSSALKNSHRLDSGMKRL